MTKQELIVLYRNLNNLGSLSGPKIAYAIARNINKIKPEMEAIDKSIEASDEYKAFENKRLELVKEHCKKDENGELIIKDGNYDVEDSYAAVYEDLKKEHADVLAAREKQIEEYNELLDTEVSIDLFKVKFDSLPEDITASQVHGILAIIED